MDNKKKKWALGAISLALVLVILGLTMANTILAKAAPDKYVLLSLLEMKKLAEKDKLPYSKDKEIKTELKLKEINGVYDDYKDMIEGWGIFLSAANNTAGDIKINTGLQNKGVNLMDLSIYSSSNHLGVKIPGLLDQYVMVNLKDFKEQYDQSILSRYFGKVQEEDINLLNDSISLTQTSLKGSNNLEPLVIDLAKSMTVKHIASTKVQINHQSRRANEFIATIAGEDLKNFIKNAAKLILDNPGLKNTSETYQEHFNVDIIDQIEFSNLEINFIIDHKKRITNTSFLTSAGIDKDEINVQLDYNLSGGDSIFNTVDVNLILESLDRHLQVSTRKDLEAKEDNFALSTYITLAEDNNISLDLLGTILVDRDEISRHLDAKEIEFKLEGFGDPVHILASGAFKIQDLKEANIQVPQEQLLDLFSLNPIQILDILKRVGIQFYNVGKMLDIS